MHKELQVLSEVRDAILTNLEQIQESDKLGQFLFQMRNYEARMNEQASRVFQSNRSR